ncbi:MAG: methyl-accepting chemotaxis protein, partial [Nitrospirae bacterium]|nr:methyl-accepting chemotaxis protein [Nitrospirota bacterium]
TMRKQYLIDRRFQLQWTGKIFLLMTAVSIIVGWTITYVVWDATTTQLKGLVAQAVLTQTQVLPISSTIKSSIALGLITRGLILIFILAVLSIFLTHRIAGPVYKIRKTIRLVHDGSSAERVVLRDHDEFQDLAREVNRLIDHFQGKK